MVDVDAMEPDLYIGGGVRILGADNGVVPQQCLLYQNIHDSISIKQLRRHCQHEMHHPFDERLVL